MAAAPLLKEKRQGRATLQTCRRMITDPPIGQAGKHGSVYGVESDSSFSGSGRPSAARKTIPARPVGGPAEQQIVLFGEVK